MSDLIVEETIAKLLARRIELEAENKTLTGDNQALVSKLTLIDEALHFDAQRGEWVLRSDVAEAVKVAAQKARTQ